MPAQTFGDWIRSRRTSLLLTQEDLAQRTGVSVRTIQNLEAGTLSAPRPATLRLLSAVIGPMHETPVETTAPAEAEHQVTANGRPRPSQLPADAAAFTGRETELAKLDWLSTVGAAGTEPTALTIGVVSGTAGVGKSALVVHWAQRNRHRFPDGQLYVNLRGFHPGGSALDPADAVRGFLDALGVPPQRIPIDLDTQAALYRSLVADKRILVVLDNARHAEQVRPLLPGCPTALVLVTSRDELASLVAVDGAHPLTLDLLSVAEGSDLLARRLGRHRVAAEPDAVAEIVNQCARLPLALTIAAARGATRPEHTLAALADELRDSQNRLDALAVGDAASTVRAVFSWSYRTLSTGSAQLFRLLGLHPGPDISAAAAASLAGLPAPAVRPLLTELVHVHLVVEDGQGRYTFHDLLRAYARHLAETEDLDGQRRTAMHRLLDHYLHTAHTADRLLNPAQEPIDLAAATPGVTPEEPADAEQALAWFSTEQRVLLAAVATAASIGLDAQAWQLAWTLTTFLRRQGLWRDQAATHRTALDAARRLADRPTQARMHRGIARAYSVLRRFDEAHTHLRQAFDLDGQIGDCVGQARSHLALAWTWARQGRSVDALHHARQAFALYQAADDRRGQAHALSTTGWYLVELGDHQQALTCCRQALTLLEALGDRPGQARTWDTLGYAHHHLGDSARAIDCYRHALDGFRDLGDRGEEAGTLTRLGDTHHAAGDHTSARDAWLRALTILDQLGHPAADPLRAKLMEIQPS